VDEDLEAMSREQLIAEARRLRAGIRAHRDSTGHALCWHHPALWGLLPEKTDPLTTVPAATWIVAAVGVVTFVLAARPGVGGPVRGEAGSSPR